MPHTEAPALRGFRRRANLAQTGPVAREERLGCTELSGERPIRGNGKVGAPAGACMYLALIFACAFALAGCGSGGGGITPPPVPQASSPASGTAIDTGVGAGQAKSTKDVP